MLEPVPLTLKEWETFYVIVGSSAGALTGLQFVVLTLISESGILGSSGEALSAFGSPNVVHFCAALLVSAIFSVPWHGLGPPGAAAAGPVARRPAGVGPVAGLLRPGRADPGGRRPGGEEFHLLPVLRAIVVR